MSWALGADTVHGLAQNSDAIVLGSFQGETGHGVDADPYEGVPYTVHAFKVTQWFKGTGPSIIEIKQSGDSATIVDDDPAIQENEKAVLFLRQYSENSYFIVAGPTGRFHVNAHAGLIPLEAGMIRSPGTVAQLPQHLTD